MVYAGDKTLLSATYPPSPNTPNVVEKQQMLREVLYNCSMTKVVDQQDSVPPSIRTRREAHDDAKELKTPFQILQMQEESHEGALPED